MSFFDQPPDLEPETESPRSFQRPPLGHTEGPWLYHPWNYPQTEIPGVAQVNTLHFERSEQAAIAITGIFAYTAGFEIFVIRRVRPGVPESSELDLGRWHLYAGPPSFQIGMRLSDGSKVISQQTLPDTEPTGPILWSYTSTGTRYSYFTRLWAWPLPPRGPLEFVCQWPIFGITETRVSIDAQVIHDAARHSVQLWPEFAAQE